MATSSLRLGCNADDFTGATDLANNLVRAALEFADAKARGTG